MAATYSIAVIGDWESVMGFRALGLDTYPVTSVEEARKTVHDLAKTNCAVIYLTETLAKDMAIHSYDYLVGPAYRIKYAGS
jgi:V/A-type H+-transporting ATPase subunit F